MGTNIKNLTPALAIHPGEMILDEIIANGFSQSSFAKHIGMEKSQLNEIIKGKRDVNTEFALILEAALGLEAIYWLNLQSQYDIDKAKIQKKNEARISAMQKFERVSEFIAYSYLKKQKVISGDPVEDIPVLEEIYGVQNIMMVPEIANQVQFSRFRKSDKLNIDKTNLIGWVKYSEYTAKQIKVNAFDSGSWGELNQRLRKVIYENINVHDRIQEILGDFGIKLLYQAKADKVPVDGIAFWSEDNPTIAMTLRHKRLDNFAFTLFHELGHVYKHLINDRNKEIIDLFQNDEEFKLSKEEVEANEFASDNLIPKISWEKFMSNHSITEKMVYDLAEEVGMNASIILGRICFEMGRYNISTNISHQIN